jgi:preprotein translocase SecE subunit
VEARANKKPRVRKSAPTVREKAEAARVESEKPKPRRVRRLIKTAGRPIAKAKLPDNRATKPVKKVGSFLKKILGWLVPRYFINSWREVKQVTWPSRRETWRLTLAVFIFAIVFGALVAGVDKALDEAFKKFILK